jgi:dihydropteroate synthase
VRVLDPLPAGIAVDPAGGAGPGAAGLSPYAVAVRIDGLPIAELEAARRALHEAGGGSSSAVGTPVGGPAAVLWATREQFHTLGRGGAEPALAELAGAIDTAVGHRLDRSARVVRGLHRSFSVGPRTAVMGIVNVTPDSFSDGGRFLEPEAAVAQAMRLASEGAALLDLGGESTRPGAAPLPVEDEWHRIAPVLARLHGRIEVPISVDTRRAEVARRALEAGADLVNDVSGLRDPGMRAVVARAGCPVIVMHMRGEPRTMQSAVAYDDVVSEVFDGLADACALAVADGIAPEQLLVDPGLGFGKGPGHNLELLARLGELRSLGAPVVVGASRKSFLGWVLGGLPTAERAEAGLAAAVAAALAGADVVRVHEVLPTVRALALADRLRGPG